MVTFSPDGRHVVVANEAEPAEDLSSDPEGSVGVIDVTGLPEVTQDDVRLARFTAYEQDRELPEGVRVFGPDVPVPAVVHNADSRSAVKDEPPIGRHPALRVPVPSDLQRPTKVGPRRSL